MKINPGLKEAIEWIICIVVAITIALLVRYYIGTPTVVESVSMKPTLVAGQRLWLSRWTRTTKQMPKRGDIITFEAPSKISINQEDVNLENPVALYDYKPEGVWNKFEYYIMETSKTSYIKRVIALPGEHVEIKEGSVFINGKKLKEEYLADGIVTDMERGYYNNFMVPENTVFALGDNRTQSTDCRVFGCVPLEKIESKLLFRFWPFNLFGKVD
jgi:signal peptidase I